MIAPASATDANERRKPVWKKRARIQASVTSSTAITGTAEGLSDTGEVTGRGNPMLRGSITGAGTFLGGIVHTLPFLIADAGPDRRRESREERIVRPVGRQGDREDRRQGRERPVDQTGHRGLHALKQERLR
jgi:hypothetical protein